MIRVALTMLGRGQWTGGEIYLRNMLTVIRDRLAHAVTPVLFLTREEDQKFSSGLAPLLPEPPVVDERVASFGRGGGLRQALLTGVDTAAARAFQAARCDVAFEPALFFGWRFPVPAVAWMPDFQHRHLPAMFTRANRVRRDLGFRAQVAAGRTVMLSSETARGDVERFYPGSRGKTVVVRFAQAVDIAALVEDPAGLRLAYGLPQRFVFLPNQFWKHKNHGLVVDALTAAARLGSADWLPLIVMSGRQDDERNPGAYQAFVARLAAAGVTDRVRHLGLIPYRDVLRLAAASDAVLNPSFFEGWSTTVEEAKALGAPLLVSDIPIHREQAPGATFFAPGDPDALLAALLATAAAAPRVAPPVSQLIAAQDVRLQAYADALLAVFQTAARHPAHA